MGWLLLGHNRNGSEYVEGIYKSHDVRCVCGGHISDSATGGSLVGYGPLSGEFHDHDGGNGQSL